MTDLVLPAICPNGDGERLRAAVHANCEHRAELDAAGRTTEQCWQCPACLVLMDQTEVNRLAFGRWLREHGRLSEEMPLPSAETAQRYDG